MHTFGLPIQFLDYHLFPKSKLSELQAQSLRMVGCEHMFPPNHPVDVTTQKDWGKKPNCQSNLCKGDPKNIKEAAKCKSCEKLFCRPCYDHFLTKEPSTSVARTPDGCRPT